MPNYTNTSDSGSLHVYMHTSGAYKRAVTRGSDACMYMCRELDNWLTAHFHAHIGHWARCPVSRITARLHAHIKCMYMCSHPCVWRVHVNVQRVRKLANCTLSSTHLSLGSLKNYMNTSDSGSRHVYVHISSACKRAVTSASDVCM